MPPAIPRRQLIAALAVPAAVVACGLWAAYLSRHGERLLLPAPPFFGSYELRIGIGTPLALILAALVVQHGSQVSSRLGWNRLVLLAPLVTAAWAIALALVDGPDGIRLPLTARGEYLHDLPRVHDVSGFLSDFTSHITSTSPDPWTTHVSGHPPGLILIFAALRTIGLGGPWPAALFAIAVGSSATASALAAARNTVDEHTARAIAPFLILLPAAIWIAVSGDAVFLGVSAFGIALLSETGRVQALAGGVLMGFTLLLTYGATTLGLIPLAAVLVNRDRRAIRLALAAVGATGVLLATAALGFNWFDGLHQTLIRYREGAGGYRPYHYYVIGNLAVLAATTGPAVAAGLTTLTRHDRRWWLIGPALIGVLAADLSGASKAEVERIWLIFVPWIVLTTSGLSHPRRWLAVQAAVAIGLQTALHSPW